MVSSSIVLAKQQALLIAVGKQRKHTYIYILKKVLSKYWRIKELTSKIPIYK
jgi:hypothetical protein